MTKDEVLLRVHVIAHLDSEEAHIEEDSLFKDVLEYIAKEKLTLKEAKELAEAALETKKLTFRRWYA